MILHGWGRFPLIDARMHVPSSTHELRSGLAQGGDGVIARGMGRSYGDSALGGEVVSTGRMNQLLAFDPSTGVLRCLAGVTLRELLDVFLPRGWFLPVTPGTSHVTVGGAIASDVHGKNHHGHGCFSKDVQSIRLLLGTGETVECSREEHADLFHATCGGMGLTGVILEATVRLMRVTSAWMTQTTFKASCLEDALALFEQHRNATYSVAWIDCLSTGASLGRSLLMLGEHAADGGLLALPGKSLPVPVDMPPRLLNRYSIKAFNALYYHRVRRQAAVAQVHYQSYFYPLDHLSNWYRLYGKPGFVQYQFVLPRSAGMEGLRTILQRIARSGRGSFLAVLKMMGEQNANPLSFPVEGYTLALDFKIEDGLFAMLEELDAMVLAYQGRLYLTKDARMSEKTFKQSYPAWRAFEEVRTRYGAKGVFASAQSRRLGLDA